MSTLTLAFAVVTMSWLTIARGFQPNAVSGETGLEAEIESPFLVPPKTPTARMKAAIQMVDFGSPQLSRQYLGQILSANPSDEDLISLRKEFGSAALLRLSNLKSVQPESSQLLKLVNAASKRQATNPEFIDGMISNLFGSPTKRATAIRDLQGLGSAVIPRMLTRWSQAEAGSDQDWLQYALLRIGSDGVPALIGALDSGDENLQSMAANTLGKLNAREAIPDLGFLAFSKNVPVGVQLSSRAALSRILKIPKSDLIESGTVGHLYRSATLLMSGQSRLKKNPDGTTTVWYWDGEKNVLRRENAAADQAALQVGIRHIRRAVLLSPNEIRYQALLLTYLFERDKRSAGWEQPVAKGKGTAFDLGLTSGQPVVSASLEIALKHRRIAAAVMSLEVLSQIGAPTWLNGNDTKTPLYDALNDADLRIQFAAAELVMKLEPKTVFPGASRVTSIFAKALHHSGEKHVLVIDPNLSRAAKTAGALSALGYLPILSKTGKDGFRIASSRGDIEFAIIHANVIRWELTATLANFRADVRTTGLPIGIFAPDFLRPKLHRLLSRTPRSVFLAETGNPKLLSSQVEPFLKQQVSKPLSAVETDQMMKSSIHWLTVISRYPHKNVFSLASAQESLFEAIGNLEISKQAISSVATLPSVASQTRLADTATAETFPMPLRVHAIDMLRQQITRHGLLLSLEKVRALMTVWKAADADPSLHTALSSLMGVLRPDSHKVGEYLQEFLEKDSK